ncbi:ORT1 [[Candida] subhashii]|uniref:ORT1 n=1 Tax=[Candida] subhashii TaxID=561895 RepID=A0A8J5UJT5_9ASCO|nr:ORT1 [[Candida] subhashii]KAG7664848.1 ORT1 [[Candida] subhashii]
MEVTSSTSIVDIPLPQDIKPKHEHMHPIKEISIGAISGMIGKLVEFPFDTIKVRLQSSNSLHRISTYHMIKSTYQNEGFFNGFYKGLKAPLVGACLETSILFTSYNFASTVLVNTLKDQAQSTKYHTESLPFWSKCVAGGFAGLMASFILTPVELIKCQLQVANLVSHDKSSATYTSLIKSTIREKGISGLFNGLSSTVTREVIGTSIWFGTYEYINDYYKKAKDPWIKNENIQLLLSGAMAGVTFNLSMFPVDTIKSNIQTHGMFNTGSKRSAGFWSIAKYLLAKNGGIRNLYNGLGITMIRCIPANALIFYSYEVLKRNF